MMNRHMFQSTHPRGVRHHWEPVPDSGASFNPRTRVGCDRIKELVRLQAELFQSTHPRGVRHSPAEIAGLSGFVSIHAPAWGATPSGHRQCPGRACFNPRTRVGCDPSITASAPSPHLFQSTHPRGVRQAHAAELMPSLGVSIHAPAWGATGRGGRPAFDLSRFNPRTRVGCDVGHAGRTSHARRSFNPRTRVGCDASTGCPSWRYLIPFQSTHPRGVRRSSRPASSAR